MNKIAVALSLTLSLTVSSPGCSGGSTDGHADRPATVAIITSSSDIDRLTDQITSLRLLGVDEEAVISALKITKKLESLEVATPRLSRSVADHLPSTLRSFRYEGDSLDALVVKTLLAGEENARVQDLELTRCRVARIDDIDWGANETKGGLWLKLYEVDESCLHMLKKIETLANVTTLALVGLKWLDWAAFASIASESVQFLSIANCPLNGGDDNERKTGPKFASVKQLKLQNSGAITFLEEWLGSLASLRSLQLRGFQLSPEDVGVVGKLPHLTDFEIRDCTGDYAEALDRLPKHITVSRGT